MAIGDISLTAGMRANLTSLQNVASLMNRTQNRLSTGKKVNSALDNSVSFFAAQSHTNRATDLSTFKDGMSEAIQTISAANAGIESITDLINSAKALASDALSKAESATYNTVTLSLNDVQETEALDVGGETLTAIAGTTGNPSSGQFAIGGTDAEDAISLAAAINAIDGGTITAEVDDAGLITLSGDDADLAAATAVDIGELTTVAVAEVEAADTERSVLATQYETLMTQITNLIADSGYKGINLLQDGSDLTVNFENSHSLTVEGFDAAADLNATATGRWNTSTDINADVTALDAALSTLRQNSSNLSSNLTVITIRQDFTNNMVNILVEGADNLTLADMNEESANMLMLQTQQQLGTQALGLSADSAQSIMALFY